MLRAAWVSYGSGLGLLIADVAKMGSDGALLRTATVDAPDKTLMDARRLPRLSRRAAQLAGMQESALGPSCLRLSAHRRSGRRAVPTPARIYPASPLVTRETTASGRCLRPARAAHASGGANKEARRSAERGKRYPTFVVQCPARALLRWNAVTMGGQLVTKSYNVAE
jgi:hypothetical protein